VFKLSSGHPYLVVNLWRRWLGRCAEYFQEFLQFWKFPKINIYTNVKNRRFPASVHTKWGWSRLSCSGNIPKRELVGPSVSSSSLLDASVLRKRSYVFPEVVSDGVLFTLFIDRRSNFRSAGVLGFCFSFMVLWSIENPSEFNEPSLAKSADFSANVRC